MPLRTRYWNRSTTYQGIYRRIAAWAVCGAALWTLLVPCDAAAKSCPNLVIVLDQSASMAQNPMGITVAQGSPDSKWSIATKALIGMNNKYDGLLPFGYSNYPTGTNCPVSTTVRIPPGYANRVTINNAMIDALPKLRETGTLTSPYGIVKR